MNEGGLASSATIFVLEKDPAESGRIRAAIESLGCAAVFPDSVDAAVEFLEGGTACDLVILDVSALGGDAGLFDRIAAARARPPQIILCGIDKDAKIALHGLNRGVRDFIEKPIDPHELARAAEAALGKKDATGQWRRSGSIVGSIPVGSWLELTASSALEQFRRVQRFSDVMLAARLPEKFCEDLKLVIEEVGRNAVEWGNNFDPDKRVLISYCAFKDRVVIKVEDEGEGFNPESLPDPTSDPMKTMRDRMDAGKRPGGYGVYLIRKLVDDIIYNDKGNIVLLVKYYPEAEFL